MVCRRGVRLIGGIVAAAAGDCISDEGDAYDTEAASHDQAPGRHLRLVDTGRLSGRERTCPSRRRCNQTNGGNEVADTCGIRRNSGRCCAYRIQSACTGCGGQRNRRQILEQGRPLRIMDRAKEKGASTAPFSVSTSNGLALLLLCPGADFRHRLGVGQLPSSSATPLAMAPASLPRLEAGEVGTVDPGIGTAEPYVRLKAASCTMLISRS